MSVSNYGVIQMQAVVGMIVCMVGVASVVNLPEWVSIGFFVFAGLFGYMGKKASDLDE